MSEYHNRARRAANAGVRAHTLLKLARGLRAAASDAQYLGHVALAVDLRLKARRLDSERRRIERVAAT